MDKEERTYLNVAREIFPEYDDDFLDYMLWEYTGFPSFWSKDEPVEDQIRRQLQKAKDNPGWHPLDDFKPVKETFLSKWFNNLEYSNRNHSKWLLKDKIALEFSHYSYGTPDLKVVNRLSGKFGQDPYVGIQYREDEELFVIVYARSYHDSGNYKKLSVNEFDFNAEIEAAIDWLKKVENEIVILFNEDKIIFDIKGLEVLPQRCVDVLLQNEGDFKIQSMIWALDSLIANDFLALNEKFTDKNLSDSELKQELYLTYLQFLKVGLS